MPFDLIVGRNENDKLKTLFSEVVLLVDIRFGVALFFALVIFEKVY